MMLCIVLPIVAHLPGEDGGGVHENALDAWHLLTHGAGVLFLVLLYWVSISFYNFCGLAVAKSLSSVHRCLIDACRTIVVWSADIILFYATTAYGEPWTKDASLVQLAGFLVMVFGTLLYYNVIKFPCCDGESAAKVEAPPV